MNDVRAVLRNQQYTSDLEAIKAINAAAFAEHGNTQAFDQMRQNRDDIVSLIAEVNGMPVGHVLFSPVSLDTPDESVTGMGLGQLAISPDWQQQGIGTQLATAGINLLRQQQCPFIIVIGHATYYPRFGFERGSRHNIYCQWEGVPDDTFMVLFPNRDDSLPDMPTDTLQGTASFDGL
jgi:putative acetyltransferase